MYHTPAEVDQAQGKTRDHAATHTPRPRFPATYKRNPHTMRPPKSWMNPTPALADSQCHRTNTREQEPTPQTKSQNKTREQDDLPKGEPPSHAPGTTPAIADQYTPPQSSSFF
ncbi:hypothetical protein BS47DRAFT_1361095 [Hydnum rufescens UP504]|uniref:Uncharacterized protein n=1 Tax=Hydnum rufescens UP504 TaxID=1448309 RepID=A0A9P6B0T9_9AGAM|nr:hypothetical protein BS47DRAFT_1361095 [Hydnum rufescens UP504]